MQQTIVEAHLPLWVALILGILSIYLALKIAHFLFKILFHIIGFGLIALAVWWLLHH